MSLEEAYTLATIVIAIFTVFNTITSLIIFMILIYDHLKDDKKLTINVQDFYEDVENLIYTHYQYLYYTRYLESHDKKKDKFEIEKLQKKYKRKNQYFSLSVGEKYDKYSKYLGIIVINGGEYMNKTDISFRTDGHILYPEIKETMSMEHIPVINDFLRSLREYWDKHYSKRVLIFKIRGKLKGVKNFKKLEVNK